MVTDVEYMQIVNEFYDLSDYKTRKEILFCNEAQKVNNLEGIVGRLYQHIKMDVNGIDFESIPRSKGIISKINNFSDMVDCIDSIHDLVDTYGESTNQIDAFSTAIDNIQKRERYFTKAFALNIEFPIMLYNITVASIVSSISLLISASVEFIKNGHESFKASFDRAGYKNSKDHVLHEFINQFNKSCSNGSLDKIINGCIKSNLVATRESACNYTMEPVDEGIVGDVAKSVITGGLSAGAFAISKAAAGIPVLKFAAIVVGAGFLAVALIWTLRRAMYYLLRAKMSISDWFEAQATYLQINAENLKYRDDPHGEDHQKKVYQRQIKWVERFRKLSNIFAIKDSKARKEARDAEDEDSHNHTYDGDYDEGLF